MALVETVHDGHLDALDTLIAREEAALRARTTRSHELHVAASAHLPGGVASSWQDAPPCPVFLERGRGSHVWDVDGTEYVDMHAGFGATLAGHGHPAIVAAVSARVATGTHFAQPVPDIVPVAAELARRFGLPMWRFTNSGTESTLAAIHLMRAATGRTHLIKVEGSYHGHHDAVQVSVFPDAADFGSPDRPATVPEHGAVPPEVAGLVHVVPFGRVDAVRRVLLEHPGAIAGMIVEPVMMNIGVVPPPPGYLDELRTLLHRHGALLTFDEVKTGLTIAPGGATERFGVVPDIVCLAKALGGGVPCGAIGGTAEVMELIADRCLRAGRHVQRQPADDGRRQGDAARGPHAGCLRRLRRPPRGARRPGRSHVLGSPPPPRLRERVRRQGRDRVLAGADPRLPRLLPLRRPLRPRPLAVPAQRRGVPPAVGEDGAVDAVGPARTR